MNRKLVLLVEDNADDEELTLRALKRNHETIRIEVTRDGQEALDWLFCEGEHSGRTSTLPDLIMLDLHLPKRSGFEVLQALRARDETRYVPVVILTSSNEHSDILNGYRYGANSYVQKPVDYDEFVEAACHLGLYWLGLNHRV